MVMHFGSELRKNARVVLAICIDEPSQTGQPVTDAVDAIIKAHQERPISELVLFTTPKLKRLKYKARDINLKGKDDEALKIARQKNEEWFNDKENKASIEKLKQTFSKPGQFKIISDEQLSTEPEFKEHFNNISKLMHDISGEIFKDTEEPSATLVSQKKSKHKHKEKGIDKEKETKSEKDSASKEFGDNVFSLARSYTSKLQKELKEDHRELKVDDRDGVSFAYPYTLKENKKYCAEESVYPPVFDAAAYDHMIHLFPTINNAMKTMMEYSRRHYPQSRDGRLSFIPIISGPSHQEERRREKEDENSGSDSEDFDENFSINGGGILVPKSYDTVIENPKLLAFQVRYNSEAVRLGRGRRHHSDPGSPAKPKRDLSIKPPLHPVAGKGTQRSSSSSPSSRVTFFAPLRGPGNSSPPSTVSMVGAESRITSSRTPSPPTFFHSSGSSSPMDEERETRTTRSQSLGDNSQSEITRRYGLTLTENDQRAVVDDDQEIFTV